MNKSIRLIAECYDTETGKVLDSKVLREDAVKKPVLLKELGYLHGEQIEILQAAQDFKIKHEASLINNMTNCPKCAKKVSSTGLHRSNFHAVFTDHQVSIRRKSCRCRWSSPYTISGVYGHSSHPDLIERQAIQGSENSYRQASRQLNAESKVARSINNDDRIRRNVALLGGMIEEQRLANSEPPKAVLAAKQLIAVIDGGHLKSNQLNARSFEAMIATVYRPENLQRVDKHHNAIIQKTSVASARSDQQQTIKQLTKNACHQEGAHQEITELTCLTDGASNCWSIANELKGCCEKLINVLDWFHVTKRFTLLINHADANLTTQLEKAKWLLWHGKAQQGIKRLREIQIMEIEDTVRSEVSELCEYIHRNKEYLVNYQQRQAKQLPFTSTLAESSVNALINARQKNDKKMQWSREGAHYVLQIRTARFSKTWGKDWQNVQNKLYQQAA